MGFIPAAGDRAKLVDGDVMRLGMGLGRGVGYLGDGPIVLRRQQGVLGRGRRLGDILCSEATEERLEDIPAPRLFGRRFAHLACEIVGGNEESTITAQS